MINWWYSKNGKRIGPLETSSLIGKVTAGELEADTLVWRRGLTNWTPINQVPEFTGTLPPPPPLPVAGTLHTEDLYRAASGAISPKPDGSIYAGFWKRFVAEIFDLLILMSGSFFVVLPLAIVLGIEEQSALNFLSYFFVLPMSLVYFSLMESSTKQATLGKLAFGIKVVDLEGSQLSFLRALGRKVAALCTMGPTIGIGAVMAGFTKRKQALHDMMASCLVVNRTVTAFDIEQSGPVVKMSTRRALAWGIVPTIAMIILAAIANPAYQDYTIRARVSEAVLATTQCRTSVAEIYQTGMDAMAANAWGCGDTTGDPAMQYVQTITTDVNGVITLKMENVAALGGAAGKTLTLTPVDAARAALTYSAPSSVEVAGFLCVALTMAPKYLPSICR